MNTPDELYTLAQEFIKQHQDEHFSHDQDFLVNRCIAYLVDVAAVSFDTAQEIVLQVMGTLERRQRLHAIVESYVN